MTVTPKTLIATMYVPTTGGTEYTVPSATATVVDNVTLTNVSSSNVTVDAWIIPDGDIKGDENRVVKSRILAPNQSFSPAEMRHNLSTGYAISLEASVATSVTAIASGREVAI